MAREKKRKIEEQQKQQGELNPEAQERKRLKALSYTNSITSETPAKGFNPLAPSKLAIKHHGRDILKKSQKKNRYLFSFPGLLAPISGGKIGDLTDLGSKNPILYLDFPQGRMKLFGTIVYPKNRYLTLQFSRGGKNVLCDDCFDTMIVFSDACWVGKKEENPDEVRLDFPKELYERKHSQVDFQGGAGATVMKSADNKKVMKSAEEESLPESPVNNMEIESPERQTSLIDMTTITPTRHSERTAGKKFNFAEASSGDDSAESVSGEENESAAKTSESFPDHDPGVTKTAVQLQDSESIQQSKLTTEHNAQSTLSTSATKESSCGSLVQATLSMLFKKVEEKKTTGGAKKKATNKDSHEKMQLSSSTSKRKNMKNQAVVQAAELRKEENISGERKAGARDERKKQKIDATEDEDDIEEFSSASEGSDGSDEDWRA